jgi:predicted nucleic acid-binding protein
MDAFDADVLIFAAKRDARGSTVASLLMNEGSDGRRIGSVVLITELFGKSVGRDESEWSRLQALLAHLDLKDVDHETAELSASLQGKYRLDSPDAIHLATAVLWGAERFHTNNSKDFAQRIDEIDIVFPSTV